MKLETRKVNKTEQAAYIARAIELARIGAPAYEGSLDPTGSTLFYSRTTHEALEKYSDLKARGWELIHEIPALTNGLHEFSARKPAAVFELDIPQISARAEAAYKAEIESHNAAVARQERDEAEVMAEFERREAERKAQLLADIRADLSQQQNPRFKRSDDNGYQYSR